MSSSSSTSSDSEEESTSQSSTKFISSKFEWSVPQNAFETPVGSTKFIKSRKFRAGPDNKIAWSLHVYPRGDTEANTEYVSVCVGRSNISDPARVKLTLGLIASDGKAVTFLESAKIFPKRKGWYGRGLPRLIRRDELLDNNGQYLWNDQVTFFCDLEVDWNLEVKMSECSLNMSRMLESGDFSDAMLVVGEEEIKVHKNVLAAGSSVFERMFKSEMKEGQSGRVVIENFDSVVIRALLSCLYSGEVEDLEEIAEKVLPAADYYGVERLKLMCEKELIDKLTVENVVELLLLADRHSAEKLKANAFAFISFNASAVAEQASFMELADVNRDLFKEAALFLTMKTKRNSRPPEVKRRKLN